MRTLATAALALALLAGCATVDPAPRVTKEDLVELHAQGVPQEALDWMQAAQMHELRRREAMMYGGGPFGPCSWPGRPGWEPRYALRFNAWPCW